MTDDPLRYFALEDRLYERLRFPDMAALAARPGLAAIDVQAAFAAANRGITPDMMRLNVGRSGWLEEVWFCLGTDFAPRRCAPNAGGAAPGEPVRVAPPR